MSIYDDGIIYMPLADAQEYFSSEEGVSAIELTVERPEQIGDMLPQITEAVGPELHGLDLAAAQPDLLHRAWRSNAT